MTNGGSILAGYGITIVVVAFYAAWIVNRGRQIGRELGIGAPGPDAADRPDAETEESSPWT